MATFRVAGLFAGIGGIELGLQRALGDAAETTMLCEWWEPAKKVLEYQFPAVDIHPDVRELKSLPDGVNLVSAGFPCTDLSQAGRTAGIQGLQSGLVKHVFEILGLIEKSRGTLPTLVIENVPNMLALDKGRAMKYLVQEIENLGYRWAYRVVDSRFTGVPQRRRRVILVASKEMDPREVLFSDDHPSQMEAIANPTSFGFYWTEGRRGLGWAQDAIPTLKGGSTIGIASPPAVWLPGRSIEQQFVTPSLSAAECIQGFPVGWTARDYGLTPARTKGTRWKLLGNAVTAGVSEWVGRRLAQPSQSIAATESWVGGSAWPTAAWGEQGKIYKAHLSEFPTVAAYHHLDDVIDRHGGDPVSHRAIAGFSARLHDGNLGKYPGFRQAVRAYAHHTSPAADLVGV